MKEWSILSDHVKYITSDNSKTFNSLSIDQLNYRQDIGLYRELQEKESLNTDLNFGNSFTKLKLEYLDVYEGIYAEIVSSNKFDKDTDLSTMYSRTDGHDQGYGGKGQRKFPHNSMRIHKGKTVRWHSMWHISGYRCKQVLYVQILLYEVQELAFLTRFHVCHNQNSSWQWTICRCFVCYTHHIDHPKS